MFCWVVAIIFAGFNNSRLEWEKKRRSCFAAYLFCMLSRCSQVDREILLPPSPFPPSPLLTFFLFSPSSFSPLPSFSSLSITSLLLPSTTLLGVWTSLLDRDDICFWLPSVVSLLFWSLHPSLLCLLGERNVDVSLQRQASACLIVLPPDATTMLAWRRWEDKTSPSSTRLFSLPHVLCFLFFLSSPHSLFPDLWDQPSKTDSLFSTDHKDVCLP